MSSPCRHAGAGVLLLAVVAACAGPASTLRRPTFPAPRHGVFQDAVAVVESTNDDMLPSIVPATDLIAYVARVSGNLDVYVRPASGGAAVRVTSHSADDTDPAFSPDGELIAWTSQAEDVKGDIWVMQADGDDKRQLTDRDTADSAPTWSPDGSTVYFTSRPRGDVERVDAIEVATGARRSVVERGWDPAVSTDGRLLFYVALDDRARPRVYAMRLADGRVAAVTDGAHIEGLPRAAKGLAGTRVLFTRWVDDQSGDGVVDADDAPSLWSAEVSDALFDGEPPSTSRPLTAGEGGEIFASVASDWLVFTTAGHGDLEIYALPADGVISSGAGPEAVLEAARAEENPSLRRLALRYLVAAAPSQAASARYELARELAERDRLSDAVEELQGVIAAAAGQELAGVAELERERLRMLVRLRGALLIREEAERRFTEERCRAVEQIAGRFPDSAAVAARATTILAEADYALGRRGRAVDVLEATAARNDVPAEDGARALDRLGEIYAGLGHLEGVGRVGEAILRRFPDERFYARRSAARWVETARTSAGVPAMAALDAIVRRHPGLPTVSSRAAVALAIEQEAQRHGEAALREWQRIATQYANEREVLAQALVTLGEAAERQGKRTEAITAYERLIAEFPENPRLRSRGRQGITRLALLTARQQEASGELAMARDSYARVLRNNQELVLAHRHYIALSARLGKLEPVLSAYAAKAEANPRDLYARYGFGFALTYDTPPPLDAAEREVVAALTLDPRFAAAHLTLGWIREQRDRDDPKGGWLEKADESFDTALSLLDAAADAELWAAAQLNRGNILFALGKTDDAFLHYLDRELSGAAFDNPLTELLFRESFARVALREDAHDVALDMARSGERLSRSLPGRPRHGTMAGLIAAISLTTGMPADAAHWYGRAKEIYAERLDWLRVVPMLRGRALALRQLGREDEALDAFGELLEIVGRGDGPEEPPRPFLSAELPANSRNVTRAIYGFSSDQEEEISRATASRIYLARGDLTAARRSDARRMELVRAAAADKRLGPRVQLELMLALNDSAILAASAGAYAEAVGRWGEALPVGRVEDRWVDVAVILESMAHVWTLAPATRSGPALTQARAAATAGLELAEKSTPELARRFAHWLALDHLWRAVAPPELAPEAAESERLKQLIGHLDESLAELDAGAQLARRARLDEAVATPLEAHLRALGGEPATATATAEREGQLSSAPEDWRWRFDRALWDRAPDSRGPDPAWLMAAVAAFESRPQPNAGPERGAFLEAAVELLVDRGELERAWLLLERARLLDMQPPVERVGREELAAPWQRLRRLRDDAVAHRAELKSAPALVRALEGAPAALGEVQAALEGGGVLLQAFAPLTGAWHWFAIDASGIRHARSAAVSVAPKAGGGEDAATTGLPAAAEISLPAEASALLPEAGASAPVLYVDAGELLEVPAAALLLDGGRLVDRAPVAEVLSATYLVASREQRKLATEQVLALGVSGHHPGLIVVPRRMASRETLARFAGSGLLYLGLAAEEQPTGVGRPGTAQVVFNTHRKVASADRLDLDELAGLTLGADVALADAVPASPRVVRAVCQALLLASVPTCIAGGTPAEELRERLAAGMTSERAVDLFAAHLREAPPGSSLRYVGYYGMGAQQRVDFAIDELLRVAPAAAKVFKAAREQRDSVLWARAKQAFTRLLDTIAFLRRPESSALLTSSSHKLARAIAPRLDKYEEDNRGNLVQIHLALLEVDEAAALQDLLVAGHEAVGDRAAVAADILTLGKILSNGKRFDEAARAFGRCGELAAQLAKETSGAKAEEQRSQLVLMEADCRSRLGSAHRDRFDPKAAVRAYQQAIMLYASRNAPNQIYPRRYLGFLYADVLNDYDRALEQFEAALDAAQRFKDGEVAPQLMLDITRVYRSRGDYDRALERARKAEEGTRAAPDRLRAEVALELAKTYWYRGNYRRALERQREGLELARRAGDSFLEIQAISLGGLIALNQGELERSERAMNAALDLSRITGRRSEEATQLNNLGIVLQRAGRLPEAVARLREALAIDEELGSVEGRAYDLRALAVALRRQGEHQEGLERATQALELSRTIGNQYNELQSLLATGEVLEALTDAKSVELYTAAVELARRTTVPEVEWRSLYALGRLAAAAGDAERARGLLGESLEVAERLGRGQSESTAEHDRNDLYADAMRLAAAAGDTAGVYELMERARARALLDVLTTRSLTLPSPRARQLLEAEVRAQEAVAAARRDLHLGREGAEQRLRVAEERRTAAGRALRDAYPRVARAFTIDPVPLDSLMQRLPEGTVVVSYFVGRAFALALVIDRLSSRLVELPLGQEELAARVTRLRQGMRAFGEVDVELQALAALLVEPVAEAVAGGSVLVVLPHAGLHHVPFSALPLDGQPLLARMVVAVSPSGSALADQLALPPRGRVRQVVAMAPAPEELPFARLQALAVAGAAAVLGPAVTQAALLSARGDALDIAAHGELDARDPLAGALLLQRAGLEDDGRLELHELFGVQGLPALVTLGACDAATLDAQGSDWLGLGGAFLFAGARTVVASAGRVSDLAAAVVMKRFYRGVRDLPAGEALRAAALRAREYFPHPVHWSSFVLIGDYR